MSLGKIYYNPEHAARFGSVAKLVKASETNKGTVEWWLSVQNTHTLHKHVRKMFPRNPYTVTNIDDVWEMDLADLSTVSKYNENYKYILYVIDIFSRYDWSVPLKDKTGTSITTALKYLFRDRKPITIQSDKGTDFVSATVQQYLKRKNVNFHLTHNPDLKGAIIESFNRTLKTKIYKYFTKNNTYRYSDGIHKLVASYNFVHSTIGIPPSKVNPSNTYSIWKK